MSTFNPDVEGLLKRFRIEKPNEEFELDPPAPDPAELPEPLDRTNFLEVEPPLVEQLQDEAARVQELLDILVETADEIQVQVPEEDRPLLGDTITTADYLKAVETEDTDDGLPQRQRHHFEWAVLNSPSENPQWPILAAGDLVQLRNSLLNSVDLLEGRLVEGVEGKDGAAQWSQDYLQSDLKRVHESLIVASAQFRFKLGQTVFTMRANMTGELLERILSLALDPAIEKLRPKLKEILKALKLLRSVFSHSQLLLAFEFVQVRDALLSIIKAALLDRMLQLLTVALSKAANVIVEPILDLFENGLGNGPLLNLLGDEVSKSVATTVSSTVLAISNQYKLAAADLLRATEKERDMRLDKLQVLGERNTVGRWVVHLDKVILQIEQVLTQVNLSRTIAEQFVNTSLTPPPPPDSKVLNRFEQHPELSQVKNLEFTMRRVEPKPVAPVVTPFAGEGPQVDDTQPAFSNIDQPGQDDFI